MTKLDKALLLETAYGSTESPTKHAQTTLTSPKTSASSAEIWLSYLYCMISGFCWIGCNLCIKLASMDIPVSSWQLNFIRGLTQITLTIPFIIWKQLELLGPPDNMVRLKILVLACSSGSMLMCNFEGIHRLSFGDYNALAYSSPVFTMLLSIFLLREHFGLFRAFICVALMVGVVFISRPSSLFPENVQPNDKPERYHVKNSTDVLGVILTLAGAILSALVTITVKQISHLPLAVQLFWFALGSLTISTAGMVLVDQEPKFALWTGTVWALAVGQSLLSFLGGILLFLSLRVISPTHNKIIRKFQVIAAYIIQVTAFHTVPHILDFFGALSIILAVLAVILEDKIASWINCRYF